MTSADIDIMAAIIEANTEAFFVYGGVERRVKCSHESARKAAIGLANAGFRLIERPVDDRQDAALEELDDRVHRLEGFVGKPLLGAE